MHARRHFWDYEYGPWRHPFGAFACCFGAPPQWRPSRREETQALKDYIADLKEDWKTPKSVLKKWKSRPSGRTQAYRFSPLSVRSRWSSWLMDGVCHWHPLAPLAVPISEHRRA